ncbi:MAG: UDP-N-acetylmuramoyl-tripeptide--D-alanyl-D-alanine ligase [Clostridia bacterium]|nr:UDP-N-acetylmuramoyl-tripeptide--D-alanyl-D-alanine ligase [Clostridia bacterium]
MRAISFNEIEKVVNGKLVAGDGNAMATGMKLDSRQVGEGDIFFPLIGAKVNAYKFIPNVIEQNAAGMIIDDISYLPENCPIPTILVDNVTKAMDQLAKYLMDELGGRRLMVTGSVGKTSTRDMLTAIVASKYKVESNKGNLNSIWGVPLSVAKLQAGMDFYVIEAGMEWAGEIHTIADIVRPEMALITNIGISHMEHLGSREGILKAKLECTDYFNEDSCLIVNGSSDLLTEENCKGNYRLKLIYGEAGKGETYIKDVEDYGTKGIKYTLCVDGKEEDVRLNLPGAHNAENSALCILAGLELGISVPDAVKAINEMTITGQRLAEKTNGKIRVIDDSYNAAPASMKSAINTLMSSEGKRKVAILADMYELGEDSYKYHVEVGEYAASKRVDLLIAVGEDAQGYVHGASKLLSFDKIKYFETKAELAEALDDLIQDGDLVLVKGSRGVEMETIVAQLLEK